MSNRSSGSLNTDTATLLLISFLVGVGIPVIAMLHHLQILSPTTPTKASLYSGLFVPSLLVLTDLWLS